MNVSIIGTGYVGLTTGACLAFLGHKVTCIDADERKVKALQAGKIPFHEPFLPELVAGARHNLSFTTEYKDAIPESQVVFIAVGTPPGQNGAPDLRYLEAAARGMGEHLGGRLHRGGEQIHCADRQRQLGGFAGARRLREAQRRKAEGAFRGGFQSRILARGLGAPRQPVPGSRGGGRR